MRIFHLLLLFFLPKALGMPTAVLEKFFQGELHGIDVSHYQKRIDWDTLSTCHPEVQFAFVKATEGADYVDSLFSRNWEELSRIGLRRGAYHFFRAYGCGYEQAIHFLKNVEMCPGDLLPVLDVERIDGMPPEILLEEMRIWLQTVERQLHCKPIIYTNQHFYERYLAGLFENYPLWIARYSEDKPVLTTGKNWHIWQFSHTGQFNGINAQVDMNLFPGTHEDLQQLCWKPLTDTEMPILVPAAP